MWLEMSEGADAGQGNSARRIGHCIASALFRSQTVHDGCDNLLSSDCRADLPEWKARSELHSSGARGNGIDSRVVEMKQEFELVSTAGCAFTGLTEQILHM